MEQCPSWDTCVGNHATGEEWKGRFKKHCTFARKCCKCCPLDDARHTQLQETEVGGVGTSFGGPRGRGPHP